MRKDHPAKSSARSGAGKSRRLSRHGSAWIEASTKKKNEMSKKSGYGDDSGGRKEPTPPSPDSHRGSPPPLLDSGN